MDTLCCLLPDKTYVVELYKCKYSYATTPTIKLAFEITRCNVLVHARHLRIKSLCMSRTVTSLLNYDLHVVSHVK